MDWKDARVRLDELARKAQSKEGDVNPVVSDSVTAITEQLGHLHQSLSHVVERLDALTSQLASLEARVHEDVE